MQLEATLTVRIPASQAIHALRDGREIRNINDLYLMPEVCAELESKVHSAKETLASRAKKIGLNPKPEILYGIHGAGSGPIEYWYQVRANG